MDLRRIRKVGANTTWQYEHSVLANIGLYIETWAGIERMLNEFIVAYHPHRISTLRAALPSNLDQKIKYLAAVGGDDRISEDNAGRIEGWVRQLGKERDYRHMMIHGVGRRRALRQRFEWNFQMLDLRAKQPKLRQRTYSNEEMLEHLRTANALSADIADLLSFVLRDQTSSTNRP
jgi:hypothetical protein